MFKRIVSLVVMAVMVFAFTACPGGNALAKYKKEAKIDLEIYATEKGEENYSEENWAEILQLLEDGKTAIDEARDEAEVDTAVKDATDAIDAVLTKALELVIYKENAKAALEAYVDEQGEANYSEENWAVILQLAEDGKTAIDEANDEAEVDTAVKDATDMIDVVLTKAPELVIYKENAKAALEAYANEKGEYNYNMDAWQVICKAVTDGNAAIDDAKTKLAVTEALNDAKDVIDAVEEDLELEEKKIWNDYVGEITDTKTIIIIIDKNFKAKRFTAEDFVGINVVIIERWSSGEYDEAESWPDNFFVAYIIEIIDEGLENLIDAIRKIEKFNFVRSVGPSYYDTPSYGSAIIG